MTSKQLGTNCYEIAMYMYCHQSEVEEKARGPEVHTWQHLLSVNDLWLTLHSSGSIDESGRHPHLLLLNRGPEILESVDFTGEPTLNLTCARGWLGVKVQDTTGTTRFQVKFTKSDDLSAFIYLMASCGLRTELPAVALSSSLGVHSDATVVESLAEPLDEGTNEDPQPVGSSNMIFQVLGYSRCITPAGKKIEFRQSQLSQQELEVRSTRNWQHLQNTSDIILRIINDPDGNELSVSRHNLVLDTCTTSARLYYSTSSLGLKYRSGNKIRQIQLQIEPSTLMQVVECLKSHGFRVAYVPLLGDLPTATTYITSGMSRGVGSMPYSFDD